MPVGCPSMQPASSAHILWSRKINMPGVLAKGQGNPGYAERREGIRSEAFRRSLPPLRFCDLQRTSRECGIFGCGCSLLQVNDKRRRFFAGVSEARALAGARGECRSGDAGEVGTSFNGGNFSHLLSSKLTNTLTRDQEHVEDITQTTPLEEPLDIGIRRDPCHLSRPRRAYHNKRPLSACVPSP